MRQRLPRSTRRLVSVFLREVGCDLCQFHLYDATLPSDVRARKAHDVVSQRWSFQYPAKRSAIEVKSAMKIPNATATQIPDIIQNLMMTVVSGQPDNSK